MLNKFWIFLCLFFITFLKNSYGSINYEGDSLWIEKLKEMEAIAEKMQPDLKESGNSRKTGLDTFNVSFECTPKPLTVHQLRPQDIDVVGAMGDSITAGNGIEAITVPGIGVEDRGLSWTIGGEQTLQTALTIPNILRNFNPQVKGYSIGSQRPTRDLWFNAAVAGARARDMPDQARDLITRMQNDSRTNYENDWKLVSVFIGGNDLCALNRDNDASPEEYAKRLEEGLDILHAELPRALVNVIEILEVYPLRDVGTGVGGDAACRAAQRTFCHYIVTANETELEVIKEKNRRYQNLTQELIWSGKYDTRDDFTVVLQPFFRNTILPRLENGSVDSSFFAPDCFHFSDKGHAMGALNLWNNMMEPVGYKSTEWSIADLKCPTPDAPYIFTNLNSGMANKKNEYQASAQKANDENVDNSREEIDSRTLWQQQMKELENIGIESERTEQNTRAIGTEYFEVNFLCSPKATTVHQLRPTDIDILAAMGDSITAGTGADATTLPGIAIAYRGISWTIGGDESLDTSITLPNILRNFNPALKGYSQGQTPGNRDLQYFNVAVPGAKARDMLNQAQRLIDLMQNDSRTNYENDWKVISIFIGGNDLCALDQGEVASPETYEENLRKALDLLHAQVPRALVNVIDILEIYLLPEVGKAGTQACQAAQLAACTYIVNASETEQEVIIELNKRYQSLTKQLIDSGRYDSRDDFTVVLQPFLKDTVLPLTEDGKVDTSFFAPDCFHFSSKGHAMGALNLWNNMLEPVHQKTTVWDIKNFKCPTEESPFFFTRLNSGIVYPNTTQAPSTTTTDSIVVTTSTKPPVVITTKTPVKTTTKAPVKTTTTTPAKTTEKQDEVEQTTDTGNNLQSLSTQIWSIATLLSMILYWQH